MTFARVNVILYFPMGTYMQQAKDVERFWYLVDARDKILGRFAVGVARLLTGKYKPTYTPNVDGGDHVVVINAKDIKVTGKKLEDKIYQKYSGYPSGKKEINLGSLLEKSPEEVLKLAVRRMLPKNKLATQMFKRLRVYAADTHPHQAQKIIVKKD